MFKESLKILSVNGDKMFRCDKCSKNVPVRTPENKYVSEYREKHYSVGNKVINGFEIVKELSLCPECFKEITGLEPRRCLDVKKESIPMLPKQAPPSPKAPAWQRKDKQDNNGKLPPWKRPMKGSSYVPIKTVERGTSRSNQPNRSK